MLAFPLSVLGRVTSSGRPVRGITLTLQPGGLTTVTGELGDYAFTNPPAGNVTVQPQAGGPAFSPASRSVTVAGGAVTGVDFTQPAAELLALQLATNRVASAQPLTATVVLTGPAPADGRTVRLSVADPLRSSVPGSVIVPPGATQASFVITNTAVSGTYENQLRAQLEGKLAITRLSASYTLLPELRATSGLITRLGQPVTNAVLPAHLDIQPGTSSNAVLVAFRETAAPQEITLTAELAGEVRTFTVSLQPTLRTISGNVGASPGLFSSARGR